MPTGKRASMREGPLAALFRKTAEDGESGEAAPRGGVRPPSRLKRRRCLSRSAPTASGCRPI